MSLQEYWHNADSLYAYIVSALQANRMSDLTDASERLLAIDSNQERAQIARGIVHFYLNQYSEAISVFEKCMGEFGESGAALTNLAKANDSLGRTELALQQLRRSLQVDPNQNAALMWYAKIRSEERGHPGMIEAFEEVAAYSGSWRPLLWLARSDLEGGRREVAINRYRAALSVAYDSDALLMISGDLGRHGLPEDSIVLVEPRYDTRFHNPHIGLNLLQCYLDLERCSEGEELVAQMMMNLDPALESQLDWFKREFAKLRHV